ncbi:DUF998 domain-containing protein [Enterococcus termitis]|nr:DUF998 domain-containing protein [Enterococcus termitis]OJG98069.1 hypothetical protein RV18_GL003765 [Enterococcus termitis]
MNTLKKYGFKLMIFVICSELIVPIILGLLYPNYDPVTMLISDFGEDGSPVKIVFKTWQLLDGSLFLLTIPSFYERFKRTSLPLAKSLSIMMGIFAIGDCLITGLFDRSTDPTAIDIEALIHDYASGIGFVALFIGIFLLINLYSIEKKHVYVWNFVLIFILSGIFMILFAAPKIPLIEQFHIPYRGLWQRANLFFLYLPFLVVALNKQSIKG